MKRFFLFATITMESDFFLFPCKTLKQIPSTQLYSLSIQTILEK